jgi:hypothetical protein
VTRWWFILLAVVLGWFTPAHAFAHPRASQAAYDVGSSLEEVVLVAGITMDTSEGETKCVSGRLDRQLQTFPTIWWPSPNFRPLEKDRKTEKT